MATAKWTGGSLNKRAAYTVTVANTWAQNDTVTITVDNVGFVITIGTLVTTTQVATTIKEALNGSTLTDTSASCIPTIADGGGPAIPQLSEFTATSSSGVVTITTNQSSPSHLMGKPITLTTGDVGSTAGDGTATVASSVTPTSQCHADQVDNWHLNAVPGNGDTVVFDTGSTDVRYGLDLGAIAVAQLTKYKTYTGNVGLSNINTDNNSKPYPEYRTPKYLTADGFTNCDLEVGPGQGSGRFKLDAGAVASTFNIYGKGTRIETGIPCILLIGTSTSNVVRNLAGDVGLAFFGGEAMSLTTLVTGDGPSSQASTICGSGVTFSSATVTCNGGFLETNSAFATGVQNGGAWVHKLGTITALTVNGGTFYPNGGATITTLTVGSGGTFDASKGNATFTITNTVQLYKGSKFIDPQGRTGNISVKLNGCSPSDVTIILPSGKTYTLS